MYVKFEFVDYLSESRSKIRCNIHKLSAYAI